MYFKNNNRVFYIFLVIWLVQSFLTAIFTELYADEAYYWMYSQFPDWGYFDHPPGVAAMIWLGSFLGKSELAVRIINIILCASAIALIYHQVKPKSALLFSLSIFSFLSLHLLGFLSLPDTPFFLFAILFLICYKRFLYKESLMNQILLGLSAALMLYSKYHGVLVILFVIASNPKLLLHFRFYISGFIGIVLFFPHIWWQVSNNFPSLQYHLVARASTYKFKQTLEYVLGNIPFHGGLVAIGLLIASFYFKPVNTWEKALKWNLFGTLVFFFFITFKGQNIEPNWTIFCVFPLLYLGLKVIENSKWVKAYFITTIFFALLLLVIKIHVIHPFFIIEKDRVWDFHLSKNFANEVEALTEDRIIVANTYQTASLLNFYTDKDYIITSLNINGRANQYSFWKFDSIICNRDIAYVYPGGYLGGNPVQGRRFLTEHVVLLDNFTSPNRLILTEPQFAFQDTTVQISFNVTSDIPENCSYEDDLQVEVNLYQQNTAIFSQVLPIELNRNIELSKRFHYEIPLDQTKNISQISIRLLSGKLGGGSNKYLMIDTKD